ncbi:hypothetical protein QJS66_23650 (plasmid) [Kocuria rhizophila]|nr:hypothetical protein QJS66_23650 [Kocuria rhizophila]
MAAESAQRQECAAKMLAGLRSYIEHNHKYEAARAMGIPTAPSAAWCSTDEGNGNLERARTAVETGDTEAFFKEYQLTPGEERAVTAAGESRHRGGQ